MDKQGAEILKNFQCEHFRLIEEQFAQMLSEDEALRLFFINENAAFTDGKNIVVDPAVVDLFVDQQALYATEDWMKLPHKLSRDPWLALPMIARAQTIHECLHILYSPFPNPVQYDPRSKGKFRTQTLAMIANIIEDAFIEAAGASEYDNLNLFLTFGRVSRLFANTPSEGTIQQAFGDIQVKKEVKNAIENLLEYMGLVLLYPMLKPSEPIEEVREYAKKIKPLFFEGSLCGDEKERFVYAQRIFDCIEPLLPQGDEEHTFNKAGLEAMLGGLKTHDPMTSTIHKAKTKPKTAHINRRLFTGLDHKALELPQFAQKFLQTIGTFTKEKEIALQIIFYPGTKVEWGSKDFDCSAIHKGILLVEEKPKINLNLKKAYDNFYKHYRININSYQSKFDQLLKVPMLEREEKLLFGSGITSTMLGDVKKRYWHKIKEIHGRPQIAFMLLIDGSGSMAGERRDAAMVASLVLHEVLKKQAIEHAIVEHRAIYDQPLVKHRILMDINAKEEEKYNLLKLDAYEGTREGLSLYWAEKYLAQNAQAEEKLILVLSDGVPAHGVEGSACYIPPVSIKDTANAVKKITKRGTKIIAVALDNQGDFGCYTALKAIYPQVVSCTDLSRLTGQLLRIISKQF